MCQKLLIWSGERIDVVFMFVLSNIWDTEQVTNREPSASAFLSAVGMKRAKSLSPVDSIFTCVGSAQDFLRFDQP